MQTLLNNGCHASLGYTPVSEHAQTGVREQRSSRPALHIPKQVMGVATVSHDTHDIFLA